MTRSGYFGEPAQPVFGWLHGGGGQADLGVVLCPPLGQEMTNSWRTQQALAEALAAQGIPCLRLDWAGCGNAADPPEDAEAGALPAWQASVDTAVDHLRRCTGVPRVALLAIRGGALVAAPVATRRPDVAAFVALAPVVSGRTLLREWRALSATAALREDHRDGALEVAGTIFSARTLRALGALSLADLVWPATQPVWVFDRDDLPTAARWVEHLRTAGVPVTSAPRAGLADMLLEPHRQVVPQAVVAEVAQALSAWRLAAPAAARAAEVPAPADAGWSDEAVVAPRVREQVWSVQGDGVRLHAVLTEPVAAGRGGAVLLLPNTGAVHHVGNHRLYVQLARALAAEGHRVIRFDLSGLGESPARSGERADVVYGRRAVDDVAVMAAAARARWPHTGPSVLGLCAGGYHALRSAVHHDGIVQCVVVNPLVFHWHEGMTLEAHEPLVQEAYYRAKWRNLQSWKRLLSGQSDLRQLARVIGARVQRGLTGSLAALRRGSGPWAPADDLDRDLQTACGRGTRLHFVFSDAEPGWPALQTQGGRALARLQSAGHLQVHHLSRADHTFSTASSRERFIGLVSAILAGGSPSGEPSAQTPSAASDAQPSPRCATET